MTTNSLNNQCLNNYLVTSATNGVTRTLTVSNTTNAANSAAKVIAQVAGGTAADPQLTTLISGGQTWSLGLDNSDSDAFVISGNAALGTTNVARVDATGVINYPLQSAFLAYLASADLNATGDGTNVVIGSITALTEIFDQNADFNVNGTFTAPITGRYYLQGSVLISGGTSISSADLYINTSNRNYRCLWPAGGTNFNLSQSVLADMDVGDTATVSILAVDTGGKIDDISGSVSTFTKFSGFLAC